MMKAFPSRVLHLLVAGVAVLAFAIPVLAQQNNHKPADNALVRLLESKGILTAQEAAMVGQASSADEANQRLAQLLLAKGMISQEEYNQTVQAYSVTPIVAAPVSARLVPAVLHSSTDNHTADDSSNSWAGPAEKILPGGTETTTDLAFGTIAPAPAEQKPAAAPPVIPAFAPIRVLPVGLITRESVKPVISAGPLHIQPYGFLKMNVIEDSSNPVSGDAILSAMGTGATPTTANIGPNPVPQFHLNARASRFGANFEWLDPSEKLVVTGKIEADFEGNFTTVFNRGISTIRSSTLGIRLAFGRLDYHATDHSGIFAEFGQDWTPFCSSTLPSSNETTLLGVQFGSCYERLMQARFGVNHDFGGSRHFQIQPEFALAFPAFGQGTGIAGTQESFGERSGADSNRPEYQSRIALQFQLDKAPAVAPAQLIVSGMYGKARLIVPVGPAPNFAVAFPGGASTTFRTFGYSAEAQLPTRWFTLQGKWWAGEALRFYFVNNLLNSFNSTAAFVAANPGGYTATAASTSGEGAPVAFGCRVATTPCPAGSAVVLPQSPVRGVGGFADLGIPLSRIFGANPSGRNAGWTLDLGYNIDQSKARDLRQLFGATAGGRYKNDWGHVTLNYKLNSWVLIGFEEGYYRTRILPGPCAPACSATNPFGSPLIINGVGVRSWHTFREQVSTIFFF